MRFTPAAVFAVLAVPVLTEALHAQRPAINSIAPTAAGLSIAAQLRLPQSPVILFEGRTLRAEGDYARASRRDGEVLMIVGGAVILTGILADEGLITIAGAAIGGYGLYLYLRKERRSS
jgi:hypothetical protein